MAHGWVRTGSIHIGSLESSDRFVGVHYALLSPWHTVFSNVIGIFCCVTTHGTMGGIKREASGDWCYNFLFCMGLLEQCGAEFQTLANFTLYWTEILLPLISSSKLRRCRLPESSSTGCEILSCSRFSRSGVWSCSS